MSKRGRNKYNQDFMDAPGDARRKEKHNHNNGRRKGRSSMLSPSCPICLMPSEFVKSDSSRGDLKCDECDAEIKKDEARFTCILHIFDDSKKGKNENVWDRCIDCDSKV